MEFNARMLTKSQKTKNNGRLTRVKSALAIKTIPTDNIVIRGARVHNLKNISLNIPRNKLVVITGLSGSGKSSLAFDTIYAEGQRRYIESLSAYARQFLLTKNQPRTIRVQPLAQ